MKKRNPINPRDMPEKVRGKNSKLKNENRIKVIEELPKSTRFKDNSQALDNQGVKEDNLKKDSFKDPLKKENYRETKEENKTSDSFNIKEKTPKEKRQRKMAERIFEENRIDENQNIESNEEKTYVEEENPLSNKEDWVEEYIESSTQAYIPQVQQEDSLPVFSLPKLGLGMRPSKKKKEDQRIEGKNTFKRGTNQQTQEPSIRDKKDFLPIEKMSKSQRQKKQAERTFRSYEEENKEAIQEKNYPIKPVNNFDGAKSFQGKNFKQPNESKENKEVLEDGSIGSSYRNFREKSSRQRVGNVKENTLKTDSIKKKRTTKFQKEVRSPQEGNSQSSSEIYDPLGKDMDNDGVIDRYDVDFRDSDVSYRHKERVDVKENQAINLQSIKEKRNYRNKPLGKENILANEKIKNKKLKKTLVEKQSPKLRKTKGKEVFLKGESQNFYRKENQDKLKNKMDFIRKLPIGKEKKEDIEKTRSNFIGEEELTRKKKTSVKEIETSKESKKSKVEEKGQKDLNKDLAKNKKSKKFQLEKEVRESKFHNKEKKISKLYKKKEKAEKKLLKDEKKADSKLDSPAILATSLTANYLYSGKEDNAGIDAAYKLTRGSELSLRKMRRDRRKKPFKTRKILGKLDKKIHKREEKLLFQKNFEDLKKTSAYQKTNSLNRFFMKKRFQRSFRNKTNESLSKRIKKSFSSGAKKVTDFIKNGGYKKVFLALGIIGLFFVLFQMGSNMATMTAGFASNITTTTYLSDEGVLSDVNNEFLSYENALQDEIDSLSSYHPGYDEYRVKGDTVGHDVHELFSYLTARFGEIKSVDKIKGELKRLFNQMYKKDYSVKTITKYDSEGEPYSYRIFTLTLSKKTIDEVAREAFKDYETNLAHYEALLSAQGNMASIFGSGNGDLSEILDNPNFGNPGIAFDNASVKTLFNEAEKHIGKKYVFGASGPKNFDCSGFVCWSFTKSGVRNMPRTTAWLIYKNYCNPISPSEAKAGDIIFFQGTYKSGTPISHVGIYAGNGMMIHAGDPIQYTSINSKYWKNHFYAFGRPR